MSEARKVINLVPKNSRGRRQVDRFISIMFSTSHSPRDERSTDDDDVFKNISWEGNINNALWEFPGSGGSMRKGKN